MTEATATPATPATPTNGAAPHEAQQPAGEMRKPATDVAAPKPPEKRAYKLKVDGREETFEGTDEDITRELQLSRAARKRLEEGQKAKAEAAAERERFRAALKEDPASALKEAGIDVDDWLARKLAEEIQASQQSPEAREAAEAKRELAKLKKEAEARQKAEEQQRANRAADEQWSRMEPDFIKALEAHPDVPRTRGTMRRIAEVGLEFLEAGIDLTPAQIVAEVAAREQGGFTGRVRAAPVEQLEKLLTPQQIQALAKREAARLRAARGQAAAQEPETKPRPTSEPKKYLSPDEFLAQSRRKG